MLIHRDYRSNICLLICTLNLWIVISCLVHYFMFLSSLLRIIILYQIFSFVCRDCAFIIIAAGRRQIMFWARSINARRKKSALVHSLCVLCSNSLKLFIYSCSLRQPKMSLYEFTMKHPKVGLKGNLPACTGATKYMDKGLLLCVFLHRHWRFLPDMFQNTRKILIWLITCAWYGFSTEKSSTFHITTGFQRIHKYVLKHRDLKLRL